MTVEVDHYTKPGAEALAQRIESFWKTRGFEFVQVTPYRITGLDAVFWGIRSNIQNGYPPRYRR